MKRKKIILLLILSFLTFYIFTAFADDSDNSSNEDKRTFHLYEDVELISTLKFAYGKPNIVIKSVYPQLWSEVDHEGIYNFNELAGSIVQEEMENFRKKVKDYYAQQIEKPKSKILNRLYIDYDSSYVKSRKNHIISIRFTIRGDINGMPRPYRIHRVINYNLDVNEELELNDLFIADSDYLPILANYASIALDRRLADKKWITLGSAPLPENYRNWNIKSNGLLITFEESTVADNVHGAQTVLIPYAALEDILSAKSPLTGCIKNKRSCFSSNLLTGGFIDEANAKGLSSYFF